MTGSGAGRVAPSEEVRRDVVEHLSGFGGSKTWFEPLAGNHGDTLILLGARSVMAAAGLVDVDRPEDADLIVINGGGGLFVQPWCEDLDRFRRYAAGFPETPIVVLPSSFWWGGADLAACLRERRAGSDLFARDWRSVERLKALDPGPEVQILADHDLAFRLTDDALLERARRIPTEDYLLIVERFDAEQNTRGGSLSSRNVYRKAAWLPGPVKRLARRLLDSVRYHTSDFRRSSVQAAAEKVPGLENLPVRYEDVSNPSRFTFEEFLDIIGAARAVITTRMHAGIVAAMLGKPTFFRANRNDYAKLQSVYEFSMKDMPNAFVIDA